ncbi:uncharacterized protein LOC111047696 [Nilaparvata lugens]|uniref:uncharacterized protein LOC111047696 n=1 Tax=Nilaparvata lugens TaxID=108931 RepID=UPI00193E6370|nr:uncharacterized protein LOC111047696 [Nilaparvata lugens]XP_039297288.1 uncharacterized protein LOC111047696 [Nilaparvata lugens]XP_039297289.1 uncharacterized protein LOC111047696 [Nilaparvata lugens]
MSSFKKLEKENYKYFIVQFDDGFELVPRKWIMSETRECYWPLCSTLKEYDRAVQSMDDPKDDWKKCHIEKILGGAKTFLRGKEKLKRAGDNSSLTTDIDEKKSRHSRALKRQFSPATSSASDGEDEDENITIPPLPKIPAIINRPSMPQGGSSANVAATPTDQSHETKTILRAIAGVKYTLATMQANQEEIKERIEKMEQRFLNNENEQILGDGEDENVSSLLPIKCDEDFNAVDDNLSNVLFKRKLVTELKKIGGSEMKNVVYNVLPKIFTNEVAEKYSWFGAKGKRALACSNFSGLIKDVVRCHFKDATDTNIEIPIKKWLSKAKERLQRDARKNMSSDENNN